MQLDHGMVSALVERESEASSSSLLLHGQEEEHQGLKRFLFPVEADGIALVIAAPSWLVDRETVTMHETYAPYSVENNLVRSTNGNFWKFCLAIWVSLEYQSNWHLPCVADGTYSCWGTRYSLGILI